MKVYNLILIITLLFLYSCVKDKPQEVIKPLVTSGTSNKVYIINEGNFGWGNASISLFNPTDNSVIEDYYKLQNKNIGLGDVCQSMTLYNNKYYVVVNNSAKIIVLNRSNFNKTNVISGFNSPRYILPITYNKAYVSDLYSNCIHVVDLNSNSITGSIPCSGWTEEMALIYNKVFVTNIKSNYCYIINSITDVITDSLLIGKGASSVVVDKNSKVWILTSGSSADSQPGKLLRINPVTLQIELNLSFTTSDSPGQLKLNGTRDTLYYLNKGVYQFPASNTQFPASPIINQGSKLFYGLGINPNDFSIYVSDAIDYIQKSKIEVYDANGKLKQSFNAGIISNGFMFE